MLVSLMLEVSRCSTPKGATPIVCKLTAALAAFVVGAAGGGTEVGVAAAGELGPAERLVLR